jgi:dipeptidyl aminopeptidase/acylaminoacyl peptidase
MWLNSAIEYFEREKLKKIVDIPQDDWMKDQSESLTGLRITTLPDKVVLINGKTNKTVVESANIYEAVISPNGKNVAFSRKTNEDASAEIWIVDMKSLKRKKITTVKSCRTLLFSMDGGRLFFQEEPSSKSDVPFYSVSRGGGKPKMLGKVRLIETLVAKGPFKGSLIAYKAVIHHLGTTSQDCAFALSENGREIGQLKNGPCR